MRRFSPPRSLHALQIVLCLLALGALLPAPATALAPCALDDRPLPSLPPQLAASLPAEASTSIEADPFALDEPIERLKLDAPPLNGGRFGLKTGLAIFKYANDRPTYYVDPTGHIAELNWLKERLREAKQSVIETTARLAEKAEARVGGSGSFVAQAGGWLAGGVEVAAQGVGLANAYVNNIAAAAGSEDAIQEHQQRKAEIERAAITVMDDPSGTTRRLAAGGVQEIDAIANRYGRAVEGDQRAMAEHTALVSEISITVAVTGGFGEGAPSQTVRRAASEAAESAAAREVAREASGASETIAKEAYEAPSIRGYQLSGGSQAADVPAVAPSTGAPGVVVRETAHMSAEARAFQRTETAIQVPWKTKPSPRMRDVVSFDDWNATTNQLVDRKINVTRYPKSVRQAQRQAEVARQHGVGVRWEVPANKVNAAKDLVRRANAEGVIEVVEGK
jgi:hypothetical protein